MAEEKILDEKLIEKLNRKYAGDKTVSYMGNSSLPSEKSTYQYDKDRVAVIKKCHSDILFFAESFFYIVNLDDGKEKIKLHDFQKEALLNFMKYRKNIMCFSRQSGKTTLLTIYALWLCTFFEYQSVVIVANKEKTAQEILDRIKLAYMELPNWIKPSVKSWGKQETPFGNGSKIQISATSGDSIRGKSVSALLLDEMAHVDKSVINDFWAAVYPTISSSKKAKVLIASTPNGVGNKYYTLWNQTRGSSDWGRTEIPWYRVPGKTPEWEKEERIALGDDLFEQEYNCKFLESGESALDEDLYNELQAGCHQARVTLEDGKYKVFKEPDLENRIYVAGVDVGEGVGKAASSVCVLDITEITNIEQVATYHDRETGVYDFSTKLHEIMIHWGKPPVAIERNNCGGTVINKFVNDFHYPNVVDFAMKQGGYSYDSLRGITSSTNTKHHGVTNMFYWLKSKQCVRLKDVGYLHELNTFIRHKNNKWGARKGDDIWDDRVDSLCWALILLHEDVVKKYFSVLSWDGNKKPFQVKPLYEIYNSRDGKYRHMMGTEENNWGVDTVLITSGNDADAMFNPDILELNRSGWYMPEQLDENGSPPRPYHEDGYDKGLVGSPLIGFF